MRIAVIYTVETVSSRDKPIISWLAIPFGACMIGSVLDHAGHTIETWVYCFSEPVEPVVADILDRFQAELIACTAVTTQFPAIAKMARAVKHRSAGVPVILGGAYATLSPEQAIACPDVDAICVGEGDSAVLEYVAQRQRTPFPCGIPSFWIKQADGLIDKTPPRPFLTDLDSLPFIRREHWSKWIMDAQKSSVILVGRGCPYICTYCSNHALKEITTGKYVRFRSVANILAELEEICAATPELQSVYLEVETITAVPNYLLELCVALQQFNATRTRKIAFGVNIAMTSRLVRNEKTCRALLAAMKEANFEFINFALESGSERLRNDVLKRPKYTNEELILFARLVREYHIAINLFVMIGLPMERMEDFLQTREVASQCQPNALHLSIYYPYPGTHLYNLAVREKLFNPETIQTTAERTRPYLTLPHFPRYKVYLGYVFFNYHVFRYRWPWHRLLLITVLNVAKSFPEALILIKKIVYGSRYKTWIIGKIKQP